QYSRKLEQANLLIEAHEIKVVPRLYDLPVSHASDCHARELYRLVCGRHSETIARVIAANSASSSYKVAFRDRVFNHDLKIRKSLTELSEEGLETIGAAKLLIMAVRKSMSNAVRREHLINRILAPLVPDLFKPTVN